MYYDFTQNVFADTTVNRTKIAVAGSDTDISWEHLQQRCLQLVDTLKKLEIPSGHPVLIFGHKESYFPLAMLACMHAKIPYIPMDKIYPLERIKKIAKSTRSQVLINCTTSKLDMKLAYTIQSDGTYLQNYSPNFNEAIYGDSNDPLSYIMFTSGSTGEPKGVQITRNAVLAYVNWSKRDFGFSEKDVFLNQAPFTFDVSLSDVLLSFALGGSLVLSSTELISKQDLFLERLKKYACTVWTSTPSFAYLFIRNQLFNSSELPALHTFLFIGEELPNRTAASLKKQFTGARVINAYGPTEATIITTFIDITEDIIEKYASLPIGFAMPGSELLIQKIETDVKEGELIIVGDHVSTGYFKREDLNKEKFYVHEGKRAFKTGDLAYFEAGMYFFLGRNDDQIKFNGFRIELTEITAVICKHQAVKDAVTVALKRNNEVKKIISFIITKPDADALLLATELKQNLPLTLPYYMIPGDLCFVDEFPYSLSHKIDKNKLIENYLKEKLSS